MQIPYNIDIFSRVIILMMRLLTKLVLWKTSHCISQLGSWTVSIYRSNLCVIRSWDLGYDKCFWITISFFPLTELRSNSRISLFVHLFLYCHSLVFQTSPTSTLYSIFGPLACTFIKKPHFQIFEWLFAN